MEKSQPLTSGSITYSIHHVVTFNYSGPVVKNRNEIRLCPRSDKLQQCESFELRTDPLSEIKEEEDQYGNRVHYFDVRGPHRFLNVTVRSVASIAGLPPEQAADMRLAELASSGFLTQPEMAPYVTPSPHIPCVHDVEEFVLEAERESGGSVAGYMEAAAKLIRSRFRYRSGVTTASSSIVELLERKAGVCQDFAHLLIAILRWRGIPARYVSGYLVPQHLSDPLYKGDRLFRTAGGHAWVEFFVPASGWIGIDPTLGETPTVRHIKTACGRDYSDAAPVTGAYQGPPHSTAQSTIEICALQSA